MRRSWPLFAASWFVFGVGFAGCRDTEPVQGRLSSGDAGGALGCSECLVVSDPAAGPCARELGLCSADPGCDQLLQCLQDAGCFDSDGLEARNRCALPCALALGVTSLEEARVLLVTDIANCGVRECSDVCR